MTLYVEKHLLQQSNDEKLKSQTAVYGLSMGYTAVWCVNGFENSPFVGLGRGGQKTVGPSKKFLLAHFAGNYV